jgi:formamidopyrimidine-DNA glycosylase
MPELPDAEVFRKYMEATSLHQRIDDVEVRSSKVLGNTTARKLKDELKGQTFENTSRHGKYLFIRLDNRRWLVIHFGMSGYLKYFKDMAQDPSHDRLLISFSNGFHLAYVSQRMLGSVDIIDHKQTFIEEKRIGPDTLAPGFDFPSFQYALSGRRATIKSALMNQHIMAGIGNIYTDEILFQAKVHPETNASLLDDKALKALFRQMKRDCLLLLEVVGYIQNVNMYLHKSYQIISTSQ